MTMREWYASPAFEFFVLNRTYAFYFMRPGIAVFHDHVDDEGLRFF